MRCPDLASRGAVALVVLGLGGCSGATLYSPDTSVSEKVGNLLAFNSTTAPPLPNAGGPKASASCPEVVVYDGTAAQRVYAGAESADTLRYQFAIGDVTRECYVLGDKLSIKVGIETRILLGPAGTPGTYSLPIRLEVLDEKTQAVVTTKTYRIAATVPPGAGSATASLLADPLVVPNVSDHSDDDYSVRLGIESGAPRVAEKAGRHRKRT